MNIIILTYESFESSLIIEQILKVQKKFKVICVVRSTSKVYKKNYLEIFKMLLKGVSIHFILFKIIQNILWHINLLLYKDKCVSKPINYLHKKYNFRVFETDDVNNAKSIRFVKRMNPDLIISIYFNQKIGRKILELSKVPALNIHPSYLPGYRGLFPYFWVLRNREKTTGVTIHIMTENFDSGSIIHRKIIPIKINDSAFLLNMQCSLVGTKLLIQTISDIIERNIKKKKQPRIQSNYYSWPSNNDYFRFKRFGKKLFSIREFWTACTDFNLL